MGAASSSSSSTRTRTLRRWGLRAAGSGLLLGLLFWLLPRDAILTALRNTPPGLFALIFAGFLASHVAAAAKWWLLMGRPCGFALAVRAHFGGLAANLCLPGAIGGDAVRAGLVHGAMRDGARLTAAAVADRAIDLVSLTLLSVLGFLTLARGGSAGMVLAQAAALMLALAASGWAVVRLKAGDPLIFARAEEEMAALAGAGIAFEVVPGISAAQGAAARLRIPLTRREDARRFQVVTGHAANGQLPDDFDWSGLTDARATTAVYMPKATIGRLCGELIARGLPPDHPATAVFDATRAGEAIVSGTVSTRAELLAERDGDASPGIVLRGSVLAARVRVEGSWEVTKAEASA